jgi:hypothetical protein
MAGAAFWLTLGLVFTLGMGWRRVAMGLPFLQAWYDSGHHFVILSLGAVLSPAVVVGLRWLRAMATTRFSIGVGIVGLGLLYWASWSLFRVLYMRAVYPDAAADLVFFDHYVRALVFSALVALTTYTAIVLIFEAVWHQGEIREREVEAARLQVALDEAHATALRARIDVDLLTDAFTNAADVMGRDVQAARTILVGLSELLRVSLRRNGGGTIALRREVELARNIVDIYTAGGTGAAMVELDMDPQVVDDRVPPLILQPALHAAFRWARSANGPDGGRIVVRARPFGDHLLLVVTADRPAAPRGDTPDPDQAAAVESLQDRLRERYSGVARARVRGVPDGGLEIRVRLERPRVDVEIGLPRPSR